VSEQRVWVLHALLSEKSSLEISILGHTDRCLMLIQCEFGVYTQSYVFLSYVTNPNVDASFNFS